MVVKLRKDSSSPGAEPGLEQAGHGDGGSWKPCGGGRATTGAQLETARPRPKALVAEDRDLPNALVKDAPDVTPKGETTGPPGAGPGARRGAPAAGQGTTNGARSPG